MTDEQKEKIIRFRGMGRSYVAIGKELGIPKDTVKSFCRRNGLTSADVVATDDKDRCRECGVEIEQRPKMKKQVFCCKACREKWWTEHPGRITQRAVYGFTCAKCGKAFTAYGNKCGDCGGWYDSKVWHSNDKYRKVIWQCNHKFDGGKKCATPHMGEETIKQLFIKALNAINRQKPLILVGFEEIRDTAFETGELEAEAQQLNGEMNVAAELVQKCIDENALIAQNQGEYAKRYDAMVERFETAKARLDEVQAAITQKQAQRKMMENFMEELRKLPEQVDSFDEGAWYAMVDFITVYGKEDVRFTFKNGMEISV